jgi:hypothetical protein
MSAVLSYLAVAENLIDTSGVVPILDSLMPTGVKRRQLSVRTVLLGFLLTARKKQPLYLTNVIENLRELPVDVQRRLGVVAVIQGFSGEHAATYRQCEDTFRRLMLVLDPEYVPASRSRTTQRGPIQNRCERERLLTEVCDRLHFAILSLSPVSSSCLSVDWSDAEAWGRGGRRRKPPTDPTAGWKRRPAKVPHLDAPTKRGKKQGQAYFGWQEQLLVLARDEGGARVPEFILMSELTRPDDNPVTLSLAMMSRLKALGFKSGGDALADSAYPFNVNPGWTEAVWALGLSPVVDIHPHDLGMAGTESGAIVFNDCLYCPQTPQALFDIPMPDRRNSASCASYDAAVKVRDSYRFRNHGRRDAVTGRQRMVCPAEAGTARCGNKQQSVALPYSNPAISNPPNPKPPCCAQVTISIGPARQGKIRQKHIYNSPEWRESYNRRTGVERANSAGKDKAQEDFSRGRIRFFGRGKQQLVRVLGYVAVNLRLLHNFIRDEMKARGPVASTTDVYAVALLAAGFTASAEEPSG